MDESELTFVYKTVNSYLQFQKSITDKLSGNVMCNNNIMNGYLIDLDYYKGWLKYTNYDEIKSRINYKDYPYAKPIIYQFRKANKYKEYQPDAIQYKFNSPKEFANSLNLDKQAYVLIDDNFWKLICTEAGLKEKGYAPYILGKNSITILFKNYGKCKIETNNNIIDSSKDIEIINGDNDSEDIIMKPKSNRTILKQAKPINYDKEILELEKVILLYVYEKEMKKKINNLNYSDNKFSKYYLISKDWISKYKGYYHFDELSKMIENKEELKELTSQGYNYAKKNMDKILKKIKMINSQRRPFPSELKDNNTFLTDVGEVKIKNKFKVTYWKDFELVNEDLKDLLSESEANGYKFEDSTNADCLIVNGKVIIDLSFYEQTNFSAIEIGIISNLDMLYNDEYIFWYETEDDKYDNINYFKNDFLKFQKEDLNIGIELESDLISPEGKVYGTAFKLPPHD